jgi:polyisoprenoid-binding protein YceI
MKRIRNLLGLLPALALLAAVPAHAAPVNYKIDAYHSEVGFTIRHMFSKVNGHFNKFSGTFVYDAQDPTASTVKVSIEAASIYTAVDRRDEHLRSPDFFDVAKFPTLEFVSKSVKAVDKDKLEITGDLTMHGVTKPVTLTASFLGGGPGMDKVNRVGFEAAGSLNRKDFGVSWNKAMDAGGVLLGEDVALRINIEASEVAPEAAPAK